MDTARIQREFAEALNHFALVLRPNADGTVYAKTALQTGPGRQYVLSIRFPDTYPNEMPRVYIDAPTIRRRRTDIRAATSATCTPPCGTRALIISRSLSDARRSG